MDGSEGSASYFSKYSLGDALELQPRLGRRVGDECGGRRPWEQRRHNGGPDELLVAVKLEFEPRLTTHELVEAINACETRVRSATPVKRLRIYVEPDLGPSEAPREAAPVAPGAG